MFSADLLAAVRPSGVPLSFHVHLPRTAGSALQRTWTDRGGWFLRLPLDPTTTAEDVRRDLLQALDAGRPVLIGGHHPHRLLAPALQPGDVVYAAVREPAERALSLYRYAVSMCQRREIVNYPGDAGTRAHWNEDWRVNVASAGLDPDDFSLAEFVAAGHCPDGAFEAYFGSGSGSASLGEEMRANGYVVLHGDAGHHLLGDVPVNRTASGVPQVAPADRELLEAHLPHDLAAFASIQAAFPVSAGEHAAARG